MRTAILKRIRRHLRPIDRPQLRKLSNPHQCNNAEMREAYGAGAEANELVQRLFEAFNRRDIDTALGLLHEEIVFEPISAVILNDGQPYVGHDGIRLYFEHVSTHWRKLQVNPIQIRAAGMAVVALGQTSGEGPGGPLVAAPTTWLFKFRDGLIAELQIFSDERLARRALAAVEAPQDTSAT